jgi:hypothetical protein
MAWKELSHQHSENLLPMSLLSLLDSPASLWAVKEIIKKDEKIIPPIFQTNIQYYTQQTKVKLTYELPFFKAINEKRFLFQI